MVDLELRLPGDSEVVADLRDEIIQSLNRLEGVSGTRFEIRAPSLLERLSWWWDSQFAAGAGLVAAVSWPQLSAEIVITISAAGGYMAKKAIDVIAELIEKRLQEKKATESVSILGPDGKVAKVVQIDRKSKD